MPGSAGPAHGDAIAIVAGEDFDEAAAALRDARARGWRITGAIVRDDDGVLIGNRFDRSLPIVDEVADAASLPEGAVAAIEVAAPGEAVVELADPLRLARLLDLSPEQARLARHAARALAGHRAAIAVRTAAGPIPAADGEDEPVATLRDGSTLRVSRATGVPAIGEVARAPGVAGEVLDAFWCGLPAPRDDARLARRLLERDAVALAVLQRGSPGDLLAELAVLCDAGVEVVGRESAAAVLGAGTTPRAGRTPFVIDLGGGTVDLHRALGEGDGEQAVVAAGGGELVTSICAALLGSPRAVAERAKRRRSVRVETPFVVHHEDGSRSFLGEPAPAEALARLCVLDGGALEPLTARLAPEVWASLRRAAKRDVLAVNALRALDAAGGAPRGELVTLVGGCAADAEAVDEIGAALAPLELAVARGDVLGRFGPRAAVAVGLVLAHAEQGR